MRTKLIASAVIILGVASFSCARRSGEASAADTKVAGKAASTAPSNDPKTGGTFTHAPSGVQLSWPDGWKQQNKETYEWAIVPAGEDGNSDQWISLDVPDLPWHPPGMIPISKVEQGYLNDLKKHYGAIAINEQSPPSIANAKVREVRTSWQKDGKETDQTAVLIVHDDHVYIFRAYCDKDHEQPTRQTFDSVVGSIKWVKKK